MATSPPNVKKREPFLALQREAREAKRGLWGEKWRSQYGWAF